jgi:hypothetical protein
MVTYGISIDTKHKYIYISILENPPSIDNMLYIYIELPVEPVVCPAWDLIVHSRFSVCGRTLQQSNVARANQRFVILIGYPLVN